MFLTESHIPQYILDLPNDALNSPMGPMLRNIMQSAQGTIRDQSIGHEVQLDDEPDVSAARTTAGAPSRKHKTAKLWKTPTVMQRANRAAIVSKTRELCPNLKGDEGVSALVDKCISLPPSTAFPVLDLLRLEGLKNSTDCSLLARSVPRLLKAFCHDGSKPARPAFMMTLRCAVNCFQFSEAASFILKNAQTLEAMISGAVDGLNHEHPGVKKAGAVLALNIVGAHERNPTVVPALNMDNYTLLLSALCEILSTDAEALPEQVAEYAIPTLAVLIDGDADALQMAQAFGADVSRYAEESSVYDQKTQAAARIALAELSVKK